MESPMQARNVPFHWTLQQPDPWETRLDASSRFSSYNLKFPTMRNNEYEPLKPSSSSYSNWSRDSISSPGGFSWQQQQQQPSGVMYPYPSSASNFRDTAAGYRISGDHLLSKDSNGHEQLQRAPSISEQHQVVNQAVAGGDATQANRAPKRHVKSACTNCKRAHLACDVPRPCTRCVQTGKTATCYDVPQKRKGRPRLRQDSMRKTGRDAITKPLSAKPPVLMAQDPRSMSSLQYFEFHPEGTFATELCNDCTTVPVAFLDMDLKLVDMNRHFKGIFGFNGDMRTRRLDQLVETADYHLLVNLRWWLRQQVDLIVANSSVPASALEYPDPSKIPTPEAHDTVGVVKTAIRRENIRFRFADGISRVLTVEFSVARAALLFVALTFPPSARAGLNMPHSYQQQEQRITPHLPSSFPQAHDTLRSYYGRQPDRLGLLPSPDSSSYFSISPSSSSFSFGSTASSLHTTASRHASIASQRSYDTPVPTSATSTIPPQLVTYPLGSPQRQNSQVSSYSVAQQPSVKAHSPQLAPLQERGGSILNSRRLPPIPGLGSPTSQSNETPVESRGQRNSWPSPDSETASPGDKSKDTWLSENSTSKRTRLDVKDLAA